MTPEPNQDPKLQELLDHAAELEPEISQSRDKFTFAQNDLNRKIRSYVKERLNYRDDYNTIRWLSWLAKIMKQNGKSEISFKEIQPSFLSTKLTEEDSVKGDYFLLAFVLTTVLLVILLIITYNGSRFVILNSYDLTNLDSFRVVSSYYNIYFLTMSMFFLISALVVQSRYNPSSSFDKINSPDWLGLRSKVDVYLTILLSISGSIGLSIHGLIWYASTSTIKNEVKSGYFILGHFIVGILIIIGFFVPELKSHRNNLTVSQKIINSLKNSTVLGFIHGVAGILIVLTVESLIFPYIPTVWEKNRLENMLAFRGFVFNSCLITAILRSNFGYIKEFAFRRTLYKSNLAPWNYTRFLDYCVAHRLLQKEGTHYRFAHPILEDYFASLSLKDQDKTITSFTLRSGL